VLRHGVQVRGIIIIAPRFATLFTALLSVDDDEAFRDVSGTDTHAQARQDG